MERLVFADLPPLARSDADRGWHDSRLGQLPDRFLSALSQPYMAGYAWELLSFVRDPSRCSPVMPRSWHGHDQTIRQQVLRQLDELGPDRFEKARKKHQAALTRGTTVRSVRPRASQHGAQIRETRNDP
jgi:hypothetical protein